MLSISLQPEPHRKIIDNAQQILMDGRELPSADEQVDVIPRDLSEEEYEAYSAQLESKIAPVEKRFEAIEDDLYDGINGFIEINGIKAPA